MSQFNEDNTVEQMLIHSAKETGWQYVPAYDVPRRADQVLVEDWLMEALLRLNDITRDQAAQVIYQLRTVIQGGASPDAVISANDEFRKLLFEKNSFPFGENGMNIPIRFFGKANENYCVITNQWEYPRESMEGGKRLDLVYLINGIPLVIGEAKTPVRPQITWADGANDICRYQKSIPEMFIPNILCFATEGKEFEYGAVGAKLEHWGPWFASENRLHGDLEKVRLNSKSLLDPMRLLDIYRFFTVFTTKSDRKVKIVCRYQQYFGGNAIVERVIRNIDDPDKDKRKGLIWHFQGSGKSWLMVFAAQKLRKCEALKNPTVVIVDDRKDLEDQITGDFTKAEIPNLASATSKEELEAFFRQDQRKILVTTIFKFGNVEGVLNNRPNIIVMVDEAHRTQEKNLGLKMRNALPNAFFFGLTGTPINRNDHNTFNAFGSKEDKNGYMSKYTFQDSIDDGATLELKFATVPVGLKLDQEALQREFDELTDGIEDEAEKNELVRRTSTEAFFTADKRIKEVCKYIVDHYRRFIEPTGMKCQVVVYNRECCLKYKEEIDALLGTDEATTIVMDCNNDKENRYAAYKRDRASEKKVLDTFRDDKSPLKFVIVTSKLLTGFDAPILQVMYLDKPMKDHTLLQAICRTNRKYTTAKKCGLIVDFVGVFDNVARSLAFDDTTIKNVIRNIDEIKRLIPQFMDECIKFFPNVDRTVGGWEGLQAAQQCLDSDEKKTEFAKRFARLAKAWEIVSPDDVLLPYQKDYAWLGSVYQSVRPVGPDGSLIWAILGPKTIEIIHRNIEKIDIGKTLDELAVDSDVVNSILEDVKNQPKHIQEVEKMLKLRLGEHKNDPNFKKFVEKLEELRKNMEENLISSIDFLRQLLTLAKEVVAEENKQNEPETRRNQAKAALTDLFLSIRTAETPIIVENVVNDIDSNVVEIVRKFKDAFTSVAAKQQIKQKLRSILWVKYKIKDNDVFNKAYEYIEQYY